MIYLYMFWIFFHRKGITSQWLTTRKQELKLTQICIFRTYEGSEMFELFSPNFCWANSFLLRVICRSGTAWLFPGVLLFSLASYAHMTTGCLKNQHDLHQGGTAVCPRRVSCILHLKNGVCSKLNPFVCILLSIKQKVRRLWLPKVDLHTDTVLHVWDHPEVFSPAALNPPASMALSLLTHFCCSYFVIFRLARSLRAWLVSGKSILKPHSRSLQLTQLGEQGHSCKLMIEPLLSFTESQESLCVFS